MKEENNTEQVVEKTLKDQIIEKMIDKLRGTENFSDELLSELNQTDLSSKIDVKLVISKQQEENEDTQAGN